MKNVRKDVRIKLMEGLVREQVKARRNNASIPKRWKYRTPRADHYITVDYEEGEIWFNTIGYNGKRYHTTCNI